MNKHYDVALFGFWYGSNYGSLLNGFATYNILRSLGKTVLMVQKPDAALNDPEINATHNALFVEKHYDPDDISKFLSYSQLKSLNDVCDTLCAGSDQIWNYNLSFHKNLFLPFAASDKRVISFATSFGHKKDKTPDSEKPIIRKYLSRYNAISVREQFSVDICRNNYGVDASLVFEPVFCVDKQLFADIAQESTIPFTGSYILTYILDPTPEKRDAILYYANISGLKVINILNGVKSVYARNNEILNLPNTLADVRSEEFLAAFINCEYVITDSFHGTAFSIIFNKPFLSIGNIGRGLERFTDLLDRLKLSNRLVLNPRKIPHEEKYLEAIDFKEVNEIIESESARTIQWLKNALESPFEKRVCQNLLPVAYYGIKSYETKKDDSYSVLSKNKCTGCSACYNVCNFNAITMQPDNEGFIYPQIDDEKCTKCGICEKICPVINPPTDMFIKNGVLGVYAAYSNTEEVRVMSTTAGAFWEFAKYTLSRGGVVYGAEYTVDFEVQHARIESIDDLPKLRQSKYYQSNINDIYKKVDNDISNGRFVLFMGCPCQTAALSSFLGELAKSEYLFIADFICHSINSPLAFKEYLKELEDAYESKARVVQFKNKDEGWHHFGTSVEFENGRVYHKFRGADSFVQAFLHFRAIMRPSCYDCSFKGTRRVADVTLADFWGLQNWPNQQNSDDQSKGVSLIITNTQKGQTVFDEYVSKNMYSEPRTLGEAVLKNGGYSNSQRVGLYRDYFFSNLGKAPFSAIVKAASDRQRDIEAERKKKQAVNVAPQIVGKITKLGNVILDMRQGSKIIIDEGGELVLNAQLPIGSNQETTITMHPNTTIHVKGKFSVAYGATWIIWAGTFTIGSGSINKFSYISVKNNPLIGGRFLCGTHLYFIDDDYHKIIDNTTGEITNKTNRPVILGDHIWFGNNVTVCKNVSIGDNSVVGTHSLVIKSVPANCLAVGSPAKVIKENIYWGF